MTRNPTRSSNPVSELFAGRVYIPQGGGSDGERGGSGGSSSLNRWETFDERYMKPLFGGERRRDGVSRGASQQLLTWTSLPVYDTGLGLHVAFRQL